MSTTLPPIDLFRRFQKATMQYWEDKIASSFVTHAFYLLLKELDGYSATDRGYPGHENKTVLPELVKYTLFVNIGRLLALHKDRDTFLRAVHQALLQAGLLREIKYPAEE